MLDIFEKEPIILTFKIPFADSETALQGRLSAKGKNKVVDKAFMLASQVENHQYILSQKNQYYNALNGHLFSYNSVDEQLHEIDIEAELKKRVNGK